MRNLLFYLFISIFSFGFSQEDYLKQVAHELCLPKYHGRGYVQKGDSLAAAYLGAEMDRIGLKKVKRKRFQSFEFNVNTFPGKMDISIGDKKLKPGVDFLLDPASGGMSANLQVLALDYETISNEELLTDTLQWLFSEKKYNALILDLTTASNDSIKKSLKLFANEVSNIFPVFLITNEKFTFSVATKQMEFPYVLLKENLWKKGESIQVDIDANYLKYYESNNVIGFLKAKKSKKKPTLVLTAHYDHLGRLGSETYFPGANDNASGTAMLMEMANYFQAHRPDYNVLFIAFAGEEAGLLGSQYYVDNPVYPLEKMSFLINLDIMGSGEDGITVVNGSIQEKAFNTLKEINERDELLKEIKIRGKAANSDHYWFSEKGVPAIFIYTMGPNKNYHDVFDTFESLSFAETKDICALIISFGEMYFSK